MSKVSNQSSTTDHSPKRRLIHSSTFGQPTSDGAGVRLTRYIGTPALRNLDPFLLLDFFESDDPNDYVAGFPAHPHRGFETVTYLMAGKLRHRDSTGHSGIVKAGGIQWMTAGRGIIHSEMPEQEEGRLAGFQLWINLPSVDKMCPPSYQEYLANEIPVEIRENSATVKVVAGKTSIGTRGPVSGIATDPLYLDVTLAARSSMHEALPTTHVAFIFMISGQLSLPAGTRDNYIETKQLAILEKGDHVNVAAGDNGARFLLVAARPLHEPIVQHGPFVMNTKAEIDEAINDYKSGAL